MDAGIKPEIKVDPTQDGGRAMEDIDEFEEDTDLHIPPPDQMAWLISIPDDVWQAWSAVYNRAGDDEVIELGKMRVYHPEEGESNPLNQKIQLRLSQDAQRLPEHEKILRNYDIKLTSNEDSNVAVFSEKDLPGHSSANMGRGRQLQPNRPSGIQPKSERYGKDGRVKYRTAIPKQTALAPKINHEGRAAPVEDAAYHEHFKRQWDAHTAPKSRVTYMEGIDRRMHPGMSSVNSFNTFGLSARPGAKGTKKSGKGMKDKAVRVDRGELLARLESCFRRYRYWSLKALRAELKQPEQWIKENLETIATLIKSGDFAMNYSLKPEYANIIQEGDDVKDELAKVESGTDMGTGDEMDDDGDDVGDFEDTKMD